MIAMAVSCGPRLLLCDEPTTALDVTVQLQVLKLLEKLCDDTGASLVFVTHDLAVVNQTCSELAVMYAGHIVEAGRVKETFRQPRHPYTRGLLESAPDFDRPERELIPIPGFPPERGRPAAGLPVRAPLRLRARRTARRRCRRWRRSSPAAWPPATRATAWWRCWHEHDGTATAMHRRPTPRCCG